MWHRPVLCRCCLSTRITVPNISQKPVFSGKVTSEGFDSVRVNSLKLLKRTHRSCSMEDTLGCLDNNDTGAVVSTNRLVNEQKPGRLPPRYPSQASFVLQHRILVAKIFAHSRKCPSLCVPCDGGQLPCAQRSIQYSRTDKGTAIPRHFVQRGCHILRRCFPETHGVLPHAWARELMAV